MAEEKRVLSIDDFEHRLLVNGLINFRNDIIRNEKPTEDIDELLLTVIHAPTKKEKRRQDRDER